MKSFLAALICLSACAVEPTDDGELEGGQSEAVTVPPELQLASGCTFIQWCNRPNSPEKIVCVLRSSCIDTCQTQRGRDSVVAACQNDARAICGTSSGITYHGCNGLGPALTAGEASE